MARLVGRLLLLVLLGSAATAQARSVAVLPEVEVRGASAIAPEDALRVVRQTLAGDGWTVFDLARSEPLPDEVVACTPAAMDRCAYLARRLLGVDVLAAVTVVDDALVEVVFVGPGGVGVRGRGQLHPRLDEEVPEASLRFAAADATREAARRYDSAFPPIGMRDHGDPPPRPLLTAERTEERVSVLNGFLGGFLVAGSVPVLGFAINTAVRDGQCVTELGGGCVERIRFREGAGVFLGAGLLLLGGGLYTLLARPIRMQVTVDAGAAYLDLSGTF